MKKEWILIFILTIPLLSGCGIYTNYHRPDTLSTDSLCRDISTGEEKVASLTDLSWEDLFADTYLQQLIREGLVNNTDLEIARLRVKEAQATLMSSKLAYLPSLQLGADGTLSSYDGQKAGKSYNLGTSVSWEVDIFGKLTNTRRKARAALEESDAYRQAVQTQVIATIAANYYSLLMLDEQVDITRNTVKSWEEYVRSLRVLMKAGQADRSTVNQAEASWLSAKTTLQDLLKQTNELENSLSAFLGHMPGAIERGQLAGQSFPQELSAGISLDLLSRRPDVREAEASLKQAFYATNQARSAFYPSITLSGSAGWTNNGGAAITNPGAWLLQAVGSLVQPLFNRGTNVANLKIAKAQQEEALLTFRQALLDAGSDVNNALTQWQIARNKTELASEQIKRLEAVVYDTQMLMKYGTTNYLEVLVARQSLLSARLNLVADRYSEIEGVINLYHALGGGAN